MRFYYTFGFLMTFKSELNTIVPEVEKLFFEKKSLPISESKVLEGELYENKDTEAKVKILRSILVMGKEVVIYLYEDLDGTIFVDLEETFTDDFSESF